MDECSKYITSLNWTNIAGGDTVYISGGNDSTVYFQVYGKSPKNYIPKVATSDIVITKGWESGHNGDVYFSNYGNPASAYSFDVVGQHIKLTNLIFTTKATDQSIRNILYIVNSSYITIDNCQLYSNGNGDPLRMNGSDHITVNNCRIEILDNNSSNTFQDVIYFTGGEGGNVFTNNYIAKAGSGGASVDIIQGSVFGSANRYETVIANNFFYMNTPDLVDGAHGIYFNSQIGNNRFLIYNNILLTNAPIQQIKITPEAGVSVRVLNNTMIGGHNNSTPFDWSGLIDTLIIKNNIIINDGGFDFGMQCHIGKFNDIKYLNIDYNHYYKSGGSFVEFWDNPTVISWSNWQSLGRDVHSEIGAVSFANIWGTNIRDYKLTSGSDCINKGIPISLFKTDIEEHIDHKTVIGIKELLNNNRDTSRIYRVNEFLFT